MRWVCAGHVGSMLDACSLVHRSDQKYYLILLYNVLVVC
jgi:hypothetical protein